jgi:hypothetical protein
MTVYLVCEDQIDNRVLNAVVVQRNNLKVMIEKAAGSTGLGAIRGYLEKLNKHNKAITIRDRDYDKTLSQANTSWSDPKATELIWRRHEIENYLLEPSVVLTFFNDIRADVPWAKDLPASVPQTRELLWKLADPLIPAHAAELLRAEITQATNTLGATKFTRPPQMNNTSDKAACREAVISEAARLRATGTALAVLPQLETSNVGSRYDQLFSECKRPEFQNGAFLCEMGGKEILDRLGQHFQQLGANPKLLKELSDKLATTLGKSYFPNLTFQPDDFDELATKLKSLGA